MRLDEFIIGNRVSNSHLEISIKIYTVERPFMLNVRTPKDYLKTEHLKLPQDVVSQEDNPVQVATVQPIRVRKPHWWDE